MTKEEKIESILENFDFQKIHKVMEFLNWTWFGSGKEVPSTYKLIKRTEEYLNECYDYSLKNKEDYGVASGGMYVTSFYEEGEVELSAKFVITSWDTV